MGEHNRPVYCPWCRDSHGRRFLCEPAAAVLAGAAQRGNAGTLPTIEMDAPLPLAPDPHADALISQFVVKGGLIPAPGGVTHPALVFTGMDAERRTLPQWIYAATDEQLRA